MLFRSPALRASETYQYDLVDIARQTLAFYQESSSPTTVDLEPAGLRARDLAGQDLGQGIAVLGR